MRRELVLQAVARDEGDAPSGDRPDRHGRRRRAVRRVDGDLFDVVQEGVETGPAEDADLGRIRHADFSFDVPDGFSVDDPEEDDESEEEELDDPESEDFDPESDFESEDFDPESDFESEDFDPESDFESDDFDPESRFESPPLVELERRESVA